jgi:8-oxo-dGTP pyrophosphatase MutT (NUDIX family)
MPQEKWTSAGGVVLEKLEKPYRVYVVKPSNNYGPWCFPKGRVDGKDSLQVTAQREVLEESGVPAEFVDGGNLGTGVGSYSITHYFLMVQSGPMGDHDFETEEVRLVTFEQAKKLFSSMGNSRDITILERAQLFLKNFDKKQNEIYLKVLKSLKEHKAESEDEVFNKYAFANNRTDNFPKEFDSKIENEVYKALTLHVSENIQMSKKISNLLSDILSKGLYSDVIKEPNEFVQSGCRVYYK